MRWQVSAASLAMAVAGCATTDRDTLQIRAARRPASEICLPEPHATRSNIPALLTAATTPTVFDQRRAYLGIAWKTFEGYGAVIQNFLAADSPAGRAGLRVGDVIEAVNGTPIRKRGDLDEQLKHIVPGSVAVVRARRNGHPLRLEVRTESR